MWAGSPTKLGCECLLLKRPLHLVSWPATLSPFLPTAVPLDFPQKSQPSPGVL